ncbi:nuclear receptor corepressor 2-like [Notechis scutatus]|uniref:Nuclear receptor corepressor 2-like n=1 Tax=Notechis scutatus TaxID=8663 RepID=A0A6J1VXE7_9SAUR|nr:nuclear receptor corepressor 2-like [Notechis scutatus]
MTPKSSDGISNDPEDIPTRLPAARLSLLGTPNDARLTSSPQKPLDLKQLKQRAAAIPPIISEGALEGALQSGATKAPVPPHTLALYQQQITLAQEEEEEEAALSKLPPSEKEPPLCSSTSNSPRGAPHRSPAEAEKEEKPVLFTPLPDRQKQAGEPATPTCWPPVLPYQGASRDVIRTSPHTESHTFQYNPSAAHPISLNAHESSRTGPPRLSAISNPPPLISNKHPSVLERTPGCISQGIPLQLHGPFSSEHAKVSIGSVALPLTMDPKKLVPFSGVKQEQLSPRSQTCQPESLVVQTSQESSVLRGKPLERWKPMMMNRIELE